MVECVGAEILRELCSDLRFDMDTISQFVEIPDDVVFPVEHSVRADQMAVYELMSIDRKIPPVTPNAKSLHTQFEALIEDFK